MVEAPAVHAVWLVSEVQFTAEEENPDPVIGHIAEPPGRRFQGLDLLLKRKRHEGDLWSEDSVSGWRGVENGLN